MTTVDNSGVRNNSFQVEEVMRRPAVSKTRLLKRNKSAGEVSVRFIRLLYD